MEKLFATAGSLSAFPAVLAGAFGANALKARLAPDRLAVFETAARHQMYHALALLALAWAAGRWPLLSGAQWLRAVTPLGGLLFLGGWFALAAALWRS